MAKKRYSNSKPLIRKKTQKKMKKIENITSLIPDENVQLISKGITATRYTGDNIRKVTYKIHVDGHFKTINGKKVHIKPYKRTVGKKYRLKRY